MDFERNDEQRAIAETARELLADRGSGDGLWEQLCDLGWPGIAVAAEHGGQGLGLLDLTVLVEELGYACAPTPMLGTVLAALAIEAAGDPGQRARWLPGLASGRSPGALALPDRPSLIPDAAADRLLVSASWETGAAAVAERGAVEGVGAIDPGRLHGRHLAGLHGEPLEGSAAAGLDRAAVTVAAELVGLCRRALDLTVAYVAERRQFGVPVGSFQAVQHAAAQMLRDTESAAVNVQHAAWVADNEPERLRAAAAMAKASASNAGRAVTAAAIQLHGGIGYTWEAEPHWLFKRAQVDAAYLGSGGVHQAALARAVATEATESPGFEGTHSETNKEEMFQ